MIRKYHSWLASLLAHIRTELAQDDFWANTISKLESGDVRRGIHIAILVDPYLDYILQGKKTIESRFGVTRRAPYGKAREGDIVILKKSGGPVQGICEINQVWFYRLDNENRQSIRKNFAAALCAQDPTFWKDRRGASYVTLMKIGNVRPLTPFDIPKKDRQAWIQVTEQTLSQDTLFS